jgi:glycosyltransferase involved in cell wall biosynthesis
MNGKLYNSFLKLKRHNMKKQLLDLFLEIKEKVIFKTGKYDQINRKKFNRYILKQQKGKKTLLQVPKSLAIVIPCYNHSQYIISALESAINQTVSPDEIIIVNDASPDLSKEIVTGWIHGVSTKTPTFKTNLTFISNKENMGQAYSLNTGIACSKSDLIMILNDDDILMDDAVEAVFKIFRHNPGIALFGGTSIPFSQDDTLNNYSKNILSLAPAIEKDINISFPEDAERYSQSNDINMTHSSCTFFKDVWKVVGGYQTCKSERIVPFSDRDIQLRINGLYPIGISSHVPFVFWRENSSVDAGKNS